MVFPPIFMDWSESLGDLNMCSCNMRYRSFQKDLTKQYILNITHRVKDFSKTPPPPNGGPPRTERSPLPCGHLPTPWGVTPFRGGFIGMQFRGAVRAFPLHKQQQSKKATPYTGVAFLRVFTGWTLHHYFRWNSPFFS